MAPFDNPPTSNLTTKISPLIENQLPEYVSTDHPLFTKFIEFYYQYLEAAEMRLTVTVDNVLQETETEAFILDENGRQIVYEDSDGKFDAGETIVGATSKATATILVDDLGNTTPRLFVTSNQKFIVGETITGSTTAATGVITQYRGNPVQNIQQLLDYADVDGTTDTFLNQLSVSFMNAIPVNLAEGVDRRNLLKNIRELYRTKGTSESFKLFIRILLNLDSEVVYPNKFMMRTSDGNWIRTEKLKVQPVGDAVGVESLSEKITGQTSGATAIISNSTATTEADVVVTELSIAYREGAFINGETIQTVSSTRDVIQQFTVLQSLSSIAVTNDGILNSIRDEVSIPSDYGNGVAEAEIESIKAGSVSGVVIDSDGTGYKIGDEITFSTTETDIDSASAFVSVIDGSLLLDGTDGSSTDAGDFLIYESATVEQIEHFDIKLEDPTVAEATAIVNEPNPSSSKTLTLDNNVGTITVGMLVYGAGIGADVTVETVTSQNVILLSTEVFVLDNSVIRFKEPTGILRLETGTTTDSDMGHNLKTEDFQISRDTYTNNADQMILEDATEDRGEIKKIQMTTFGYGYTRLPTAAASPIRGTTVLKCDGTYQTPTTASLLAITTDIGAVDKIRVKQSGANYSTTDLPDAFLRANFVLKDVTGTFVAGESLTTHTGIVKSYNSDTQVLQTTLEDSVRVTLETTDALPIGLEDGSAETTGPVTLQYENTIDVFDLELVDEEDGDKLVLNASELVGDAFIALEDDTGGILRTEPSVFFEPMIIQLEDESGFITTGSETTTKTIRQFPRGRKPNRTWQDRFEFVPGRQLTDSDTGEPEFGPARIVPRTRFQTDEAWEDSFGVFILNLTTTISATAQVNNSTIKNTLVKLDNNSGTIDVGMKVSGTAATANVNGSTNLKNTIVVDSLSGTIDVGMKVSGTGINSGTVVTEIISSSLTETTFTINDVISLDDDVSLTFSIPDAVTVSSITSQAEINLSLAISLVDNTTLTFTDSSINGNFEIGEEITGQTSGATALILDKTVGPLLYIGSNDKNFIVGETIVGDKTKLNSLSEQVNTTATVQTLGKQFVIAPESIWIEYDIETEVDHEGILLESGNTAIYNSSGHNIENGLVEFDSSTGVGNAELKQSRESDEIVLEEAGFFRDIDFVADHLLLDGTRDNFQFVIDDGPFALPVTGVGGYGGGGFVIEETSGDIITLESEGDSFIAGFDTSRSTFDQYDGQNDVIILDGDLSEGGNILLERTDSSGTDAGDKLLDESSSRLPQGVLILDGTDASGTDAGSLLLGEIEPETGVLALDGTDSSQTHAGDSVIHEDGIDFSAGTTVITASGGFSGTIVNADISKAVSTVATTRDVIDGYGTDIESILGEDLNRLQDSLYYQQFSYQIETGAGSADYINELKKAVHPTGFAVFGKVKIAQAINEPMTLSSITEGLSISAFSGDPDFLRFVRRSLGSFALSPSSSDDVIVLETSISDINFEDALLIDSTDGSSDAGGFFLQESATAGTTTNNLILDATDLNETDVRGDILLDGTDSDGSDAGSSLELEDELHTPKNKLSLERIDNPVGIDHHSLLNEDGGNIVAESSFISGSENVHDRYAADVVSKGLVEDDEISDVSLVRSVKMTLSKESSGNTGTSTGIVNIAKNPFINSTTRFETELGTIESKKQDEAHHRRIIGIMADFLPTADRQEGQLLGESDDSGLSINDISKVFPLLLDGVSSNHLVLDSNDVGTPFSINDQADIIIEDGGTDGNGKDAGAAIELEDSLMDDTQIDDQGSSILFETDVFGGGQILDESSNSSPPISDFIRPAIFDIGENAHNTTESSETIGILLEGCEAGTFKQEDESTVATTHGDDILLEDATGYSQNEKLLLEGVRLELESNTVRQGVIPHQNYLNTTFDNLVPGSEVISESGLSLALEDSTGPDHMLLDATNDNLEDAGFFILEETRGDQMLLESTETDFADQSGLILFNGTDSDSTDAGDKALLELATRSDVLNNSAFTVAGVPRFDKTEILFDSTVFDMSSV